MNMVCMAEKAGMGPDDIERPAHLLPRHKPVQFRPWGLSIDPTPGGFCPPAWPRVVQHPVRRGEFLPEVNHEHPILFRSAYPPRTR
jgi:hypothetical protein